MFLTLLMTFLLVLPGLIAKEVLLILKKESRVFGFAYLIDTLIFSFLILGANVLFKTLLGGGNQIFMIMATNVITLSLVKYIGLSLVFALLLPHAVLLTDLILRAWAKKFHD